MSKRKASAKPEQWVPSDKAYAILDRWMVPHKSAREDLVGKMAADKWPDIEPIAAMAAGDVFKVTAFDPNQHHDDAMAALNVVRMACIKAYLAGAAVSQSARKNGGKNGGEKRRVYDPVAMRKYHARKVASGLSWTASKRATAAHYGCSLTIVHNNVGRKNAD